MASHGYGEFVSHSDWMLVGVAVRATQAFGGFTAEHDKAR
jgi:hypothetical protein